MDKNDINVKIGEYTLNCRACAIILNDNKILFQKRSNDKYWALPGGKIEVGEKIETTIKRELEEELGIIDLKSLKIHSITEYFFDFNNEKFHQYIFSYIVELNNCDILQKEGIFDGIEKEKDIIYKWLNIDTLDKELIKPDFLKKTLINIDKNNIEFISYVD